MKKKIFAIALAASIAVLAIAGTSMAYFTDTKQYTNVFTAGKVDITLTEAVAAKNATTGNIEIADVNDRISFNADTVYNPLFPQQKIAKDPTIKNIGTEEAYFGAIITITNVAPTEGVTVGDVKKVLYANTAAENSEYKQTSVANFIKGLPEADKATVTIKETDAGFVIYVVYNGKYAKDASATVFTGIEIPSNWDNKEMAQVNGLKVNVQAYAVQTAGMTEGSLKALQAAFVEEFKALN